jgi:hypothetical protein
LTRWQDILSSQPDFAARVQALFDSRTHKVLATIRKDGSPRLSGVEVTFSDGEVWIGSMLGSRKNDDLARDPRLSLLVSSDDPPKDNPGAWAGDARLSGVAQPVDDPQRLRSMSGAGSAAEAPEGVLYRIDITEAVLTRVAPTNDHLLIESWTPGRGYRETRRV